jgi:GxxExxY protein
MSGLDDEKLIEEIIGAAYEVRKRLAQGYLESTYENALIVELQMRGLFVENQVSMEVDYKGVVVGVFKADLLVEKRVIIEIKAVSQLNKIHELQLVNYLTTTHIDHGILVNFGGDKFEVKRKYREYKSTR